MPDTFSPPYGLTVTDLLDTLDEFGQQIAADRHNYPERGDRYMGAYGYLSSAVGALLRGRSDLVRLRWQMARAHLSECTDAAFSHWLREAEARRAALAAARSDHLASKENR